MEKENKGLGASASPTALSSPSAIEPAAQSRPSGLQSTGAWTPGPWDDGRTVPVRGDAVSLAFLCAAEPGSPRDIEAQANARLIAAAPELYEALTVINRRASPAPDRTLGDCADELMRIADIARAVLARVRGEQA